MNGDEPRPAEGGAPWYKERLLAEGQAVPYFIWPNIDPFLQAGNLLEAVPDWFGGSLSLSGDLLIVGAPSGDTQGLGSGTAYVFA